MSIVVVKHLSRLPARALRTPPHALARARARASASEAGPPNPTAPPPGPACPEPPPCPPMPHCPPAICPQVADPNNPCNYCPPPCIDPSQPDLAKLKKLQCLFQQEDNLPIFLKKGNADAFLYQLTLVLILISLGYSFVTLYKLAK